MFVDKAGAFLIVEQLKFTFTWVGSLPFLQSLDKDGKACQGQTLLLITKICKLRLEKVL